MSKDATTGPTRSSAEGASAENVARGEQLDVTVLVQEYHRVLYRYAYRLTGSVADAEDLVQQTFLLAQQKLDQLRDSAKVRGWLFAVLRNCFLKQQRKRKPLAAGDLEIEVDQFPQPWSPADEIDGEGLQLALNELPDEFRLVLVMHYFEQASYREIAEQLEIPMGTVMSRLSRAKGHLRRNLLLREQGKVKRPDQTSTTSH